MRERWLLRERVLQREKDRGTRRERGVTKREIEEERGNKRERGVTREGVIGVLKERGGLLKESDRGGLRER
jgi:hypothetical protein